MWIKISSNWLTLTLVLMQDFAGLMIGSNQQSSNYHDWLYMRAKIILYWKIYLNSMLFHQLSIGEVACTFIYLFTM